MIGKYDVTNKMARTMRKKMAALQRGKKQVILFNFVC